MKPKFLILEDGTVFEGISAGAPGETVGELVFTTGMCGYPETLTDPSYYGQIVVQTFPMIGNYGIISADFEGKSALKGYVISEVCEAPSNFRCEGDLQTYLEKENIPAISGLDTRELTRILRNRGVMNAKIADEIPADLSDIKDYRIVSAVRAVTCEKVNTYGNENAEKKVALLDYGAKASILRPLIDRGYSVTVFPADTSAEEILSGGFDGIMLSDGPGDPAENVYQVRQIQKLFGKLPMLGICLGHQLMALAAGAATEKLKYGHRGANQPVKCLDNGRTYITSQNHGYTVPADTVKQGRINYINANDSTVEGISYGDKAFSVQFHPEVCAGSKNITFLFDKFVSMMEAKD